MKTDIPRLHGLPATLDADKMADLLDMSRWAVYDAVKRDALPVQPFRVGRSLRWPTARVLDVLGLDPSDVVVPAADPSDVTPPAA